VSSVKGKLQEIMIIDINDQEPRVEYPSDVFLLYKSSRRVVFMRRVCHGAQVKASAIIANAVAVNTTVSACIKNRFGASGRHRTMLLK
jgi:hypothetical protein